MHALFKACQHLQRLAAQVASPATAAKEHDVRLALPCKPFTGQGTKGSKPATNHPTSCHRGLIPSPFAGTRRDTAYKLPNVLSMRKLAECWQNIRKFIN
jgi:hypothetical protein